MEADKDRATYSSLPPWRRPGQERVRGLHGVKLSAGQRIVQAAATDYAAALSWPRADRRRRHSGPTVGGVKPGLSLLGVSSAAWTIPNSTRLFPSSTRSSRR